MFLSYFKWNSRKSTLPYIHIFLKISANSTQTLLARAEYQLCLVNYGHMAPIQLHLNLIKNEKENRFMIWRHLDKFLRMAEPNGSSADNIVRSIKYNKPTTTNLLNPPQFQTIFLHKPNILILNHSSISPWARNLEMMHEAHAVFQW